MRTTLNIDDGVLEKLKSQARRNRISLGQTVNQVLRAGLERLQPRPSRSGYKCTTYAMGYPPHSNLDKAMQLASFIEDEESVRKLMLGK